MPAPRLALAGAVAALAVLSACAFPPDEGNTGTGQGDRTITPPTVLRTPVRVPTAPATEPLPGPTGSAQAENPGGQTTFSPGPDGGTAEQTQ